MQCQVRDTQNSIVSTDVAFSTLQENRISDRQLIVIKQYHKKKKRLASFHFHGNASDCLDILNQ